MRYKSIRGLDREVSVVALGCWAFAGDNNWGPQDDDDSIAAVHAALERGINFFDTAEGYGDGHSEEILGKALGEKKSEVVIASKPAASHTSAADIRAACEASLKRLRRDYIDLYQQHWPNRDVPMSETVEVYERLREEGKIRAWGVCNYGPEDFDKLLAHGTPATNQIAYSLLWRAIEYSVQTKCSDNEIGMLCYSPIAQGLLTGKYQTAEDVPEGRARTKHFSSDRPQARHGEAGSETQTFESIDAIRSLSEESDIPMIDLAIGWVLNRPAVTSVLVGARNPEQVHANAAAADRTPNAQMMGDLTRATDLLKAELGNNPDPWAHRMR